MAGKIGIVGSSSTSMHRANVETVNEEAPFFAVTRPSSSSINTNRNSTFSMSNNKSVPPQRRSNGPQHQKASTMNNSNYNEKYNVGPTLGPNRPALNNGSSSTFKPINNSTSAPASSNVSKSNVASSSASATPSTGNGKPVIQPEPGQPYAYKVQQQQCFNNNYKNASVQIQPLLSNGPIPQLTGPKPFQNRNENFQNQNMNFRNNNNYHRPCNRQYHNHEYDQRRFPQQNNYNNYSNGNGYRINYQQQQQHHQGPINRNGAGGIDRKVEYDAGKLKEVETANKLQAVNVNGRNIPTQGQQQQNSNKVTLPSKKGPSSSVDPTLINLLQSSQLKGKKEKQQASTSNLPSVTTTTITSTSTKNTDETKTISSVRSGDSSLLATAKNSTKDTTTTKDTSTKDTTTVPQLKQQVSPPKAVLNKISIGNKEVGDNKKCKFSFNPNAREFNFNPTPPKLYAPANANMRPQNISQRPQTSVNNGSYSTPMPFYSGQHQNNTPNITGSGMQPTTTLHAQQQPAPFAINANTHHDGVAHHHNYGQYNRSHHQKVDVGQGFPGVSPYIPEMRPPMQMPINWPPPPLYTSALHHAAGQPQFAIMNHGHGALPHVQQQHQQPFMHVTPHGPIFFTPAEFQPAAGETAGFAFVPQEVYQTQIQPPQVVNAYPQGMIPIFYPPPGHEINDSVPQMQSHVQYTPSNYHNPPPEHQVLNTQQYNEPWFPGWSQEYKPMLNYPPMTPRVNVGYQYQQNGIPILHQMPFQPQHHIPVNPNRDYNYNNHNQNFQNHGPVFQHQHRQ